MSSAGITACGAYVPRLRLKREAIATATAWANPSARHAGGERSMCNWDEDSVTMAVGAARECVTGRDRAGIGAVWLASTTLPFADRDNAVLVSEALGLAQDTRTLDASSSLRAATSVLVAALQPATIRPQLIIAADRRLAKSGSDQELRYGHGAAAILISSEDVIAEYLGSASIAADLVDHYRAEGEPFDYALEDRWVRDEGYLKLVPQAIAAALKVAEVQSSAVTRLLFPGPEAIAKRIIQTCALPVGCVSDSLVSQCGDTGAAHPLLLLAHALDSAAPGEILLLLGFGQGADALILRTTAKVAMAATRGVVRRQLERRTEELHYLRYLAHCGLVEIDWGLRAERDNRTAQTVAYRRRNEITGFVGGRCRSCGTVQFPKARLCVNPECRATDTLEDHPLADSRGRVKSFTEDWLAYSPRPPLIYGNVEFAEGGNLMMEFTDVEPGELAVGDSVTMVFRIKDVDRVRGFKRYFWKATRAEH